MFDSPSICDWVVEVKAPRENEYTNKLSEVIASVLCDVYAQAFFVRAISTAVMRLLRRHKTPPRNDSWLCPDDSLVYSGKQPGRCKSQRVRRVRRHARMCLAGIHWMPDNCTRA